MLYYILVFDNDPSRFRLGRMEWDKYGGCLTLVSSAEQARLEMNQRKYDMIVLTADFLKKELLPTIHSLREFTAIPIMVLTSRYSGSEKMAAIRASADDYLQLTENIEEAVISGIALLRRTKGSCLQHKHIGVYRCKDIMLDTGTRTVRIGGSSLNLTRGEFNCLELLVSQPGNVFGYDAIYFRAFGQLAFSDDVINSVRGIVARVRSKLGPELEKYIQTVRGVGYCMNDTADEQE